MLYLGIDLLREGSQRFVRSFQLIVFFKVFFCIFHGGKLRVQRNDGHFTRIVIFCFKRFCARCSAIAVSIQQFAPDTVFVALFSVL